MPINESKAFQKFRSRIDYLNQHQQVVDAALKNTTNWLSSYRIKTNTISEALGLIPTDYTHLNHPVKDFNRIFSYTKAKNTEFALIEVYNAFSCYLKDLLIDLFDKDPIKVVGKVSTQTLSFVDLVNLGSFENISERMINSVFRKLEDEKSTPKLLDRILSHTNIVLDDALKTEALMYLEMRHLIIHNGGKADERFKTTYGTIISLKADGKIPTTFETFKKAIDSVSSLTTSIDNLLITNSFIDSR